MDRVVMETCPILYLSTTLYLRRGYSLRLGDVGVVGAFGVHLHTQRPPTGAWESKELAWCIIYGRQLKRALWP